MQTSLLLQGVLRRREQTGSAIHFYSNSGDGCVFSPSAGVQPHSLIQSASLKRIGAQETEEGEGSLPQTIKCLGGGLCVNKGFTGSTGLTYLYKSLKGRGNKGFNSLF